MILSPVNVVMTARTRSAQTLASSEVTATRPYPSMRKGRLIAVTLRFSPQPAQSGP